MHLHMPLLAFSVHYHYNALRNIIIIIIIIINCWYIGLTKGGVKSMETRATEILLEN